MMANMGATQFAGAGFLQSGADGMGTQKVLSRLINRMGYDRREVVIYDLGAVHAELPVRSIGEAGDPSADSLRNLTVHQLMKAQNDGFNGAADLECDGRPIKTVAVVGVVVSKAYTATEVTFHVYDGTGTIACRSFVDDRDAATVAQDLHEGSYVQVYGSFKGALVEDANSLGPISVFAFYPVEDHNQVVHQQLSAIFQHMYLDRKRNGENAHGNVGMQSMGMGNMQGSGMPLQQQGAFPGAVSEAQAAEIVYAWLKEQHDPQNQGFKQEVIVAGLAGRLAPDMVLAGIRAATANAKLYDTIDNYTHAAI